jgi:hypothetical protein
MVCGVKAAMQMVDTIIKAAALLASLSALVGANLAKITNSGVLAANKIDHVPLFADVEI